MNFKFLIESDSVYTLEAFLFSVFALELCTFRARKRLKQIAVDVNVNLTTFKCNFLSETTSSQTTSKNMV